MTKDAAVTWSEGSRIALVWPGGFALLAPSYGLPAAQQLWEKMRSRSDLGAFLSTLTEVTGTDYDELPSFAAAFAADEAWHLAVRGRLGAQYLRGSHGEALESTGTEAWDERVVLGATALRLGEFAEQPGMPIVEGVVLAGGIGFGMWPLPDPESELKPESEPDFIDPGLSEDTVADITAHEDASTAPGAVVRPQDPAAVPEVMLPARLCAIGHPNPPERGRCFECGQPVGGEICMAPRPRLGWLLVPQEKPIALTGPLIVGRHPTTTATTLAEPPTLVALPQRHISGSHLAIVLDGWKVVVVDLGSRNGTCLRRRAKPPVRLPQRPVTLLPGDVIDLGHDLLLHLDRIP